MESAAPTERPAPRLERNKGANKADKAAAMRRLGQRYVPAFNRRHGRTGTLWEGRFKSCLVDSDAYLFTVHCYIELNPAARGCEADLTPELSRTAAGE